eukprot:92428-Chlamydomonas_euryale.AAC.4
MSPVRQTPCRHGQLHHVCSLEALTLQVVLWIACFVSQRDTGFGDHSLRLSNHGDCAPCPQRSTRMARFSSSYTSLEART